MSFDPSITMSDDPSLALHPTGRRCASCGGDIVSWLEDAAPEERTDKAVAVGCTTERCTEARQPLLGLGLYAAAVEELLTRIGAVGDPPDDV